MGKDLNGKELGKGLSQRSDKRYEARAVINGTKIHIYDLNLNELKRRFEKEKDKIKRGNVTTCPDITVSEWFEAWFAQYKEPTLKPSGVIAYKRKFLNTYGRILGVAKVKELNQFAVQTATSQLVNENYIFKTIRDALSIFKLMLDSAVANFVITNNPCLGVIVPSYNVIQEDRRVLTKQEQQLFLEAISNSFYNELYRIMLSTGIRVGEMGALRWQNIDFDNGFITVNRTLSCQYVKGVKTLVLTSPKTKNSNRKIPFFKETKSLLLAQKEKQDTLKQQLKDRWRETDDITDLVFTTTMGSPVTRYNLESDMRSISKQLQVEEQLNAYTEGRDIVEFKPIHPHCLRHTFATRCFEKGMTPKTVQSIMGHANINMTMSYTHALDDIIKGEADIVGNFFDNEA